MGKTVNMVLILAAAGVGVYLITRPTPKVAGPLDMAKDALGAIGSTVGGLAGGVMKVATPIGSAVGEIGGELGEAIAWRGRALTRAPGMAFQTGKGVVKAIYKTIVPW